MNRCKLCDKGLNETNRSGYCSNCAAIRAPQLTPDQIKRLYEISRNITVENTNGTKN